MEAEHSLLDKTPRKLKRYGHLLRMVNMHWQGRSTPHAWSRKGKLQ